VREVKQGSRKIKTNSSYFRKRNQLKSKLQSLIKGPLYIIMTDDSKTVKIPLFGRKSKNFVMCWIQFKAYAKVLKFHQALNVDPKTNLPIRQKDAKNLDCADAGNKNAIKAMDQNEHALSSC
jgi:hypothetical protein